MSIFRHPSIFVLFMRILALGWVPTTTLLAQTTTTVRQSNLSFSVVSSDGKSVVGALAVLVPPGHTLTVTDGKDFDNDPAYILGSTDSAGRLSFSNLPAKFLLVIIDAVGSTLLTQDEVHENDTVQLTAWGNIEGRRSVGKKPGGGLKVIAWGVRGGGEHPSNDDRQATVVMFVSHGTADSLGSYQIARTPPGEANVAPDDPTNWGARLERPMRVVKVHSGMTTTLNIGGRGCAVVGHVALPPGLSSRHDWSYWLCSAVPSTNAAASIIPKEVRTQSIRKQIDWWNAPEHTSEAAKFSAAQQTRNERMWAGTYPFDIQDDQTFRIEDVEPGSYRIDFYVQSGKVGSQRPICLAEGQAEFTVNQMPGGRSDTPLEIPTVAVAMVRDVNVGDLAPDFTAPALDDHPLQLSHFRGKYVLLQFWATWCGPCVGEMENVKAVYQKFGSDQRLAMISLSADETPDRPAGFVAAHHLGWNQGYLGGDEWDSPIEKLYAVRGIPSIWLIGPDGKVIGKNLQGEELMKAVEQALSK